MQKGGKEKETGSQDKVRTRTLNFKRPNFTILCSILHDIEWDQILVTMNTEKKQECFKDLVNNGTHEGIPLNNKYKRTKVAKY